MYQAKAQGNNFKVELKWSKRQKEWVVYLVREGFWPWYFASDDIRTALSKFREFVHRALKPIQTGGPHEENQKGNHPDN